MKLFTQYLWRDEPDGNAGIYSGWQSGLYYLDGRAKPSLKSFPTPFVLDAARSRLWGQVRAARHAHRHRAATPARELGLAHGRDPHDRRAGLLELDDEAASRAPPTATRPGKRSAHRHAQVELPRGSTA